MLRGPSGGGKTTLLNLIGTIDRATSGSVGEKPFVFFLTLSLSHNEKKELFDHEITSKSTDSYLSNLRLAKIGFVFQTFNLLATMSAFENVELPMTILGKLSRAERQERAQKLLTLVGLQDRMDHLPSELSGGEQQRVTIARALANEPEILLLDEPTGDLDSRNTIDVMDLILELNLKLRTTMVMVTHNPDVEQYADRLIYLQDGRFVKQSLNRRQTKLDYAHYIALLNSRN